MKDRRIPKRLVFVDCDSEFAGGGDDCKHYADLVTVGECIYYSHRGDGMCHSQRRNIAALKENIDTLKAQLAEVRKFR